MSVVPLQNNIIVVAGLNHLTFYKLVGTNLIRKPPVVGSKGKVGKMLCIAWAGNNECVVGTSTGKLYKFKEHVLQQVYNAHTGAVTCCFTTRTGIVTGGRDGTVKLWSFGLDMQVSAGKRPA